VVVKGNHCALSAHELRRALDALAAHRDTNVTALASPSRFFGVSEDIALWPQADLLHMQANVTDRGAVFVAGAAVSTTLGTLLDHSKAVHQIIPKHLYLNLYGVEDQLPQVASALPDPPAWARRLIRERKFRGGNLWVGSNTTSALHFEGYDNILMVLSGLKRLTLFPPNSSIAHHEHHIRVGQLRWSLDTGFIRRTLQREGQTTACRLPTNLSGHQSEAWRFELRPGDLLYLPALWWHQVESEATGWQPCVAVNHWFQPWHIRRVPEGTVPLRTSWPPITHNPVYDWAERAFTGPS